MVDTALSSGRSGRRVTSKSAVLATLCLAALIINIDVTIVNVALPSLVRQLHATTTQLQWVVDAYTLVFAALILAAGSVSDRVGRKGVLLAGLGVFAVGSLAGSLAETPNQLIAARAVMGVGAAGIFPATLSLIANVFTERAERAKAIGLWGATTGIGVAAGPIVGGWLLEHFWWGSVFLFMVPVAVVVAGLIAWVVPTSRDPNIRPLDGPGLLLSSLGMGTLVFGIIQAPDWGWGSNATIGTLVVAGAVLAVFVAVERRTKVPMMDVGLFRNARFTAASGSITIGFFVLAGFTFLITQYFQFVKDYSPFATGIRLLPVAMSIAVAAVVGTRLAVRVGNNVVVATGLAMWGAAVLWISTVSTATTYYELVGQMILGGGGLGLITAPATEAIMGAVPTEKAGVGSAVNDATRLFGAALGVAVIGSIAASLYSSRLGSAIPHGLPQQAAAAADGSVGGALVAAKQLAGAGLVAPAQNLAAAAVGAFLHSVEGALRVAGGVALAGSVMAGLLLPARPRAGEDLGLPEADELPAVPAHANGNGHAGHGWVSGTRRLRVAPSPEARVVGSVTGTVRVVRVDGGWAEVEGSHGEGWLQHAFVLRRADR